MAVLTRSFVLQSDAEKRFWDITWDGPMVEISSGKWGTTGRSRDRKFALERERDAFIADEIRKTLKKGYLESNTLAPIAAAPNPQLSRAQAFIAQLESMRRSAARPVFSSTVGAFGTVRGPMMLDAEEPWPLCSQCGKPLSALLELDLEKVPIMSLQSGAVAQVFWCEASEQPSAKIICTGGYLARFHRRTSRIVEGPPPTRRVTIHIADWIMFAELPPYDALRDAMTARLENVDFVNALATLVPGIDTDAAGIDVYNALTISMGAPETNEHKLGGWPTFVQAGPNPASVQIFQLEHGAPFTINFGDGGAGHLFFDTKGQLEFYWSCH